MAAESWMVERAKEELEMLEAKHPNRFDYLKLELKSLISDDLFCFNGDAILLPPPHVLSSSSAASTQVSSNLRKRKGEEIREGSFGSEQNKYQRSSEKDLDRAEMAIERAQACLRRIRLLKQSFFR